MISAYLRAGVNISGQVTNLQYTVRAEAKCETDKRLPESMSFVVAATLSPELRPWACSTTIAESEWSEDKGETSAGNSMG